MDSFEVTKVAGAVLSALLLVFGMKTFIDLRQEALRHGEHAGYTLPTPAAPAPAGAGAAPAAGGAVPAASGFDAAKAVALVSKASVENGAATFKKCQACHTSEKAGANKAGPNLWGIVGRKIASHEGFGYSDAMKAKGGEWSFAALAAFLHAPKTAVPGTKMVFTGLAQDAELAEMLAYLRTLADSPAPLPQ